jgi:hypothetical protein
MNGVQERKPREAREAREKDKYRGQRSKMGRLAGEAKLVLQHRRADHCAREKG